MTSKINELVDQIYTEAIMKAEKEAGEILGEAEKKAVAILKESKLNAAKIVEEAEEKSKEIYRGIKEGLRAASEQTLAITKQKVEDCIVTEVSGKAAGELLSDSKFVQTFFIELVKKWNPENSSIEDLTVLISEEQQNKLQEYFTSIARNILEKQPKIEVGAATGNGFQIVSASGKFKISFVEKDFENFFKSLMKPKMQHYLFSNNNDA